MSYSLKADILTEISEEELIQLTDDESAGIVNEVRVTAAIAKADRLIDSYCGQVETVPFTTIPDIIKEHSITIAIYYLYSRRGVVPEIRKENYKDAIAHLKDIATGKAVIGATTEGEYDDEIKASGPEDEITGENRIITKDKLENY